MRLCPNCGSIIVPKIMGKKKKKEVSLKHKFLVAIRIGGQTEFFEFPADKNRQEFIKECKKGNVDYIQNIVE